MNDDPFARIRSACLVPGEIGGQVRPADAGIGRLAGMKTQ
jgi:hypothetical protein